MDSLKIVIGANFGDEGKGLVTDYLCNLARENDQSCLVVLANGGAQRGHTVHTPEGDSHVFHHFGSGTFAGADTFLYKDFILNPMTFHKEYEELVQIGVDPRVCCDAFCRWSTPWDMMVNQIIESFRDSKRHGSCGMGIWETVLRHDTVQGKDTRKNYTLSCFNDFDVEKKKQILTDLRDNYFISRLAEEGIDSVPSEWQETYYSDQLVGNFIEDVDFFIRHTKLINAPLDPLRDYQTVIFENGQGLLLDSTLDCPESRTTPSVTGAMTADLLLRFYEFCYRLPEDFPIELCYVTRTYMTKHGAGAFPTEKPKSELFGTDITDTTNVPNDFQGALRYGELAVYELRNRIEFDSEKLLCLFPQTSRSLFITHTNERDPDPALLDYWGFDNVYESFGKKRSSVIKVR